LITVASLFHPIEHLGFVYSEHFLTMPSRTHPQKEDFWDSGKRLPLSNTFEAVKIGIAAGAPVCERKKAAIAGGLSLIGKRG
jgi:hypothetical protein